MKRLRQALHLTNKRQLLSKRPPSNSGVLQNRQFLLSRRMRHSKMASEQRLAAATNQVRATRRETVQAILHRRYRAATLGPYVLLDSLNPIIQIRGLTPRLAQHEYVHIRLASLYQNFRTHYDDIQHDMMTARERRVVEIHFGDSCEKDKNGRYICVKGSSCPISH